MVQMRLVLVVALAGAMVSSARAAQWATLSGRILYDGNPPTPKRIVVDKDKEVCGKHNLIDESLLVEPGTKGIKNVVIMLMVDRGKTTEVHESYRETEKKDVLLNNKNCRFEPHVILLRTTQKLVIRNSDPIGNNVRMDMRRNRSINITIPTGKTHEQVFPNVESMPSKVSCSIHSWESGWIVVKDHPYMVVTDENGRFEIKNVPVGVNKFMFWHEEAGYLREVTVDGKAQQWRRGCTEQDLKPGQNDLGDIVVGEKLFQ